MVLKARSTPASSLVATDQLLGPELVRADAGANHVEAVEGALGGDALEIPLVAEMVVGDLQPEVFADRLLRPFVPTPAAGPQHGALLLFQVVAKLLGAARMSQLA